MWRISVYYLLLIHIIIINERVIYASPHCPHIEASKSRHDWPEGHRKDQHSQQTRPQQRQINCSFALSHRPLGHPQKLRAQHFYFRRHQSSANSEIAFWSTPGDHLRGGLFQHWEDSCCPGWDSGTDEGGWYEGSIIFNIIEQKERGRTGNEFTSDGWGVRIMENEGYRMVHSEHLRRDGWRTCRWAELAEPNNW